jgi:hypothetical protein
MAKSRLHTLSDLVMPCLVAAVFLFPLVGAFAQLTRGHAKFFDFRCPPLQGLGQKEKPSRLTMESWLNGTFQKDFDEWFSTNFGARVPLVRLSNEIGQRLFGITSSGILVDARHNLYTGGYLKDYYHACSDSDRRAVSALAGDLAELQDLLHRKGIAFVYLVTPSKAAIRPAVVQGVEPKPASYRVYNELIAQLRRHKVNYVDGHLVTQDLESLAYPTFPQGGLHWSELAAVHTFNEVLKSINNQLNRTAFSTVSIGKTLVEKPDPVESDLANLMNMMKPLTNYECIHGQLTATDQSAKKRSALVLEGSSFCGQLTAIADKAELCKTMRHYFYFTRTLISWPDGRHVQGLDESAVDWDGDVFSADAIVVENNEALNFDHNAKFVRAALNKLKEPSKLAETRRAI